MSRWIFQPNHLSMGLPWLFLCAKYHYFAWISQNYQKSIAVHCLGRPYLANIVRNSWLVRSAVVDFISITSGHLLWASTITINIRPKNGPAKSTCIRSQLDVDKHVQTAFVPSGTQYTFWQDIQCHYQYRATRCNSALVFSSLQFQDALNGPYLIPLTVIW